MSKMDLWKATLLKKPLRDSLLNNSAASIYESAAEDSDNSLYYSFTDSSMKNFDDTINTNEFDAEASIVSEADKENTVIMNDIGDDKDLTIEEQTDSDEKMEVDNSVIIVENEATEQAKSQEEQKVSEDKQIPNVSGFKENNHVNAIPQIIVEDPNENLINPFTFEQSNLQTLQEEEEEDNSIELDERKSLETNKVTKKKMQEVNKKSASKIPTISHFYSPVQRKSIDKKSKIIVKPLIRRTIYETRTAVKSKNISTVEPVQAKEVVPKPARKTISRPIVHKCKFSGCLREFRTLNALQEHAKTHNSHPIASTSAHSSYKCKWCDKVFELNTALTSHMLEKCTKITFIEKRKLLAQQEKANQANDNKRKSVFAAPKLPKKRSPTRRQTLNKSGIMITPKKTLKCNCGMMFTDVLEFANHTVSHKYEEALKNKVRTNDEA